MNLVTDLPRKMPKSQGASIRFSGNQEGHISRHRHKLSVGLQFIVSECFKESNENDELKLMLVSI